MYWLRNQNIKNNLKTIYRTTQKKNHEVCIVNVLALILTALKVSIQLIIF